MTRDYWSNCHHNPRCLSRTRLRLPLVEQGAKQNKTALVRGLGMPLLAGMVGVGEGDTCRDTRRGLARRDAVRSAISILTQTSSA